MMNLYGAYADVMKSVYGSKGLGFDMQIWLEPHPECGSTGCIFGHAVLAHGSPEEQFLAREGTLSEPAWEQIGARILGLTPGAAHLLSHEAIDTPEEAVLILHGLQTLHGDRDGLLGAEDVKSVIRNLQDTGAHPDPQDAEQILDSL